MSRATPPTTRSSRRWRVLAFSLVGVLVVGGVAIATFPRWGGGIVQGKVIEALEARSGGRAAIQSMDLDFESAVIHGLELRLNDASSVKLDTVKIQLVPGEVWSGRVVVDTVEVEGGHVEGDVGDFLDVVRKARSGGSGSGEAGRVRLRPRAIEVSGISYSLGYAAMAPVHVEGQVGASVDLNRKEIKVDTRSLSVALGERRLALARASTTLTAADGGDAPGFPITLDIEGAGTAITPTIAVAGVHGQVSLLDQALEEIAVDLGGTFSDSAESAAQGVDLWSLEGTVRRDLSAGSVRLNMEAFELARVPQVLERLPLVDSERATIGGHIETTFADGTADVAGELSVKGLNVNHPMLASTVVRDVGFSIGLEASVDPARSSVTITKGSLRRGDVAVEVTGSVTHPVVVAERRYDVRVSVPPVPCQKVLAAIPAELAPSLQGFVLTGDFEMNAEAKVDLSDLEHLTLTGRVGVDKCAVKSAPPRVAASRLQGNFTHRAVMRDGREVVVELNPRSGTYTPLAEISPWMVTAVLTTEDGGFWRHKGFLPSQFEVALRRNLEAGRIRLGASTISMQMVKNVLLSHERTFARKFQEFFLTWYVERSLPKERIMEIYLNVIEFGPGIYGVTRAAAHYFGKKPADLTPPEAAYLALMLPSPVRRHANYCEGAPTAQFKVKIKRIVAFMNSRGRMDDETFALWKDADVTFDLSELKSKNECLAEIKRLLAASEKQRALSGLLEDGATAAPEDTASDAFDLILEEGDPGAADAPGKPAMDYDFLEEAP